MIDKLGWAILLVIDKLGWAILLVSLLVGTVMVARIIAEEAPIPPASTDEAQAQEWVQKLHEETQIETLLTSMVDRDFQTFLELHAIEQTLTEELNRVVNDFTEKCLKG